MREHTTMKRRGSEFTKAEKRLVQKVFPKPRREIELTARERYLAHGLGLDKEYKGHWMQEPSVKGLSVSAGYGSYPLKKSDNLRIRTLLKARLKNAALPEIRAFLESAKSMTLSEVLQKYYTMKQEGKNLAVNPWWKVLKMVELEEKIEGKSEEYIERLLLLESA